MELVLLAINLIGFLAIGFIMVYGLVDAYKLNKKMNYLQQIESRFVKRDYTITKEESLELPELYLQIHKGLEKRSYYQEKILKEVSGDSKGKDIYELTEKMAMLELGNMNSCIEFLNKYRNDLMYKSFVSAAAFIIMLGLMFIIMFAHEYMQFGAIVSGVIFLCFIYYVRQIVVMVPNVKAKKIVSESKKKEFKAVIK